MNSNILQLSPELDIACEKLDTEDSNMVLNILRGTQKFKFDDVNIAFITIEQVIHRIYGYSSLESQLLKELARVKLLDLESLDTSMAINALLDKDIDFEVFRFWNCGRITWTVLKQVIEAKKGTAPDEIVIIYDVETCLVEA